MLSRKTQGLIALGLAALVLRVALVFAISTEHRAPLTYEHGEIADNLLAGRGFTVRFLGVDGPTSQQAPLYPAMLAGIYWLFGSSTPQAILAMQLLQCVAGAATTLCVAWLAWSLFDRPVVGWIAGWGAALYPPHVYMTTHIQVVPWATLLLTLLAAIVLSPNGRGRWEKALLAGVLSGVMLLFDPILVLGLPILALAMCMRGRGANEGADEGASKQGAYALRSPSALGFAHNLRSALVMTLVCLAVIAPWIVRNLRVHGELVFIKSTFGYAFWQGNNAQSWGTDKIPKPAAETLRQAADGTLSGIDRALWEARHETYYIDDLLLKPDGYLEFVGLSEPARSRLLGQRAWKFIRDNPGSYLRLCAARLRYFLLFDETNPKAANRVYRVSTLVWIVLAIGGLLAAVRDRQFQIWPLVAIFVAVMLFHVLTIVSARFRMPLEPLTFVWCGWGVSRMLDAVRGRQLSRGHWVLPLSRKRRESLAGADEAQLLADL